MPVESREARDFHVREAIACGWDKRMPQRKIQSFYLERILKSTLVPAETVSNL